MPRVGQRLNLIDNRRRPTPVQCPAPEPETAVFVLGMVCVTMAIGAPAEAQNYPWCAIYDVGDAAYNCGFISREQCMATVKGIGGFCNANTQYVPPAERPVPRARRQW